MYKLFGLVCVMTLLSCQDKVICPAFQSTYILDDSTREAYFSYYWQLDEATRAAFLSEQKTVDNDVAVDTLSVAAATQPETDYYAYAGEKVVPWRIQKRTKYGIIKKVPYPIRNYRMKTAPMENVYGPKPSTPEPDAGSFVASTYTSSVDTAGMFAYDSMVFADEMPVDEAAKQQFLFGYDPSDNFNVEQEYYNKYFAYRFIEETKEAAKADAADALSTSASDSTQTKKPFLKRLFGKKNKKTSLTAEEEAIDDESVDEESTDTATDTEQNGAEQGKDER